MKKSKDFIYKWHDSALERCRILYQKTLIPDTHLQQNSSTQQSACLYTNHKFSKKKVRKIYHSQELRNTMKSYVLTLIKEVKDLYNRNCPKVKKRSKTLKNILEDGRTHAYILTSSIL